MWDYQVMQQVINILFVVLDFGGDFIVCIQFLLLGIIFIVYQVFNVVFLLCLILGFILVIVSDGVECVGCIYCFDDRLMYMFVDYWFFFLVNGINNFVCVIGCLGIMYGGVKQIFGIFQQLCWWLFVMGFQGSMDVQY